MARICKHSGCSIARASRKVSGVTCPECGFALHSIPSIYPYLGIPAIFAVALLLLIPLCSPKNLNTRESRHTPSPRHAEENQLPVSPDLPPLFPAPAPRPPVSGSILARAEQLADEIDPKTIKSATGLAQALARRGEDDEISDPELLAAVVYRWVAKNISYDVDSLDPTSRAPQDPDIVLKMGKAVCEGYACLCEFLLNQNHVEARIVHGLARSSDHLAGRRLSMQTDGHAWLIAKWGGEWHFMEPTWGAGSVNEGRFAAKFSWEWFDADPAIAIYSHIPEESQMQLLDTPVLAADIEKAAVLNFGFFRALDVPPQPLINGVLSQGSGEPVIFWKIRPGFRIAADAISEKGAGSRKVSVQGFTLPSGLTELRFPNLPPDTYLLRMFSGKSGDKELYDCGLFLLRQSGPSGTLRPPVTSQPYHDLGAQLLEPLQGDLASGSWQRFAIHAEPGLTFALRFEGESTVHYMAKSEDGYENRLLLRPGRLVLCQIIDGKMVGILEFHIK